MMRRRINTQASLIILLTTMLSAISCSRDYDFGFKDLCFYHPHTAPVEVDIDWNKFRHIEDPTGMTAYVWSQDPEEEAHSFVSHNINEITLNLESGHYNAFVFNQTAAEYATLQFFDMDDHQKAQVKVAPTKSPWYTTKLPDSKLGTEPEWLAIGNIEDFEVTEEMVAIAEEEFLAGLPEANKHAKARTVTRSQFNIATITPISIIKQVDLYVHLENLVFLRSGLGAIEGMAEGCYISTRQTSSQIVTHSIDSWSVKYDIDDTGAENLMKGAIKASITTFGLPAGHTGSPEDNILYVRLLLVDNQTLLEMEFPIGDILKDLNSYDGTQTDENGNVIWPQVHVYWPEPLPEVEPVGGTGGAFDVGVGEWGDEIITTLPLM